MQVKRTNDSKTSVTLTISASETDLSPIKLHVLNHFVKTVKIPGFRSGKAPLAMVEKYVDQASLQSEFLEHAIEELYVQAVRESNIRVIGQPKINLTKFVPFTTIEFIASAEIIGEVKLPAYKTAFKRKPNAVKVSAEDVSEVVKSLQTRLAVKKDVDRAAKNGDELYIDFKGTDAKGKAVAGAEGKDYPLVLGSKTFIPGFEENLVGLKAGEQKTFIVKFPKDYGVKALASKDVTFEVQVVKVQEVELPKVDDAFAAQAGPFKTVQELKDDIKNQLTHERQHESSRDFESQLVKDITAKSTVDIPDMLVEEQVERLLQEVKQNVLYRGQTFPDFLELEGKTEEEYRGQVLKPDAVDRVKAGLVLSEISEQEGLTITPEELEIRLQLLKGQYKDAAMQAELDKQENQQEIASRLLTEKTLQKLVEYATK